MLDKCEFIIIKWGSNTDYSSLFCLTLFNENKLAFMDYKNASIQLFTRLKMFQTNLKAGEVGNLMRVKSASEITNLDSSIASVSTATIYMPPQQQQYHSGREGVPSQPFTIRVNMGNLPVHPECHIQPSCSQTNQLKAVNVKRICEAAGELKRGLLIYRYLQKNKQKCKQIIISWFQDLEAAFLNSLNRPPNQAVAQALLQEDLKARSRYMPVPCQENKPLCFSYSSKPISQAIPTKEIDLLKQEVENYRRDSIESLQKIDEVIKMVAKFKAKYEAEKKERKALSATVNAYVEEGDRIIQKIASRSLKEGKIGLGEQEVRQVLTKLKFQAYSTSVI